MNDKKQHTTQSGVNPGSTPKKTKEQLKAITADKLRAKEVLK